MEDDAQKNTLVPENTPAVKPSGVEPTGKLATANKMKLIMVVALAAIFLVGGGAAAYVQYVVNSPQKVWERALGSTSMALDELMELNAQPKAQGSKIDGSFSMTSPVVMDGSVSGQWHGGDGVMNVDFGVAGVRVDAEVRSIEANNPTSSDMYFKIDGLSDVKSILSIFGLGFEELDSVLLAANNKWYGIDHTLIDQLAAPVPGTPTDSGAELTRSLLTLFNDTLLSTDEGKAVFNVISNAGNEDFEGTNTQKFEIGIDKNNIKKFTSGLKDLMESEEFSSNALMQTYAQLVDFNALIDEIESYDFAEATAEVWVEANGKYIRNIRFYSEDKTSYMDISVPYEDGSDVIPITLRLKEDSDDAQGAAGFGVEFNRSTLATKLWFDVDVTFDGVGTVAKGEIMVEASDEEVEVAKPEESQNVYELLDSLLGGLFGGLGGGLGIPSTEFEDLYDYPLDDFEL